MGLSSMGRGFRFLIACCLAVFASGRAEADTIILSGTTGMGPSMTGVLETFNTSTNAFSNVLSDVGGTTTGPMGTNVMLSDIGFTSNGTLYGVGSGPMAALYTINYSGNSSVSTVMSKGSTGQNLTGLGGDGSSNLYGAGNNQIYTVNQTTGLATATSSSLGGTGGINYNPVSDIVDLNGQLYVTANNPGPPPPGTEFLLKVDSTTGLGSQVGSGLGISGPGANIVGLAAVSGDNTDLYAFTDMGNVYKINVTTGAASQVTVMTSLAAGVMLTGAANNAGFAVVPEPSSLILCGVAGVVSLVVARVRRKFAA
jgi:hypothetical protein